MKTNSITSKMKICTMTVPVALFFLLVVPETASAQWTTNGNDVYKTNTSGSVGIGTTTPAVRLGEKLDVATSADFGGTVLSTWSSTSINASLLDLVRSRSNTIGTQSAVTTDDLL